MHNPRKPPSPSTIKLAMFLLFLEVPRAALLVLAASLLQACGTVAAPGGSPNDSVLPPWVGGINNGNDIGDDGPGSKPGSGGFNNNHGGDNSGNTNEDSNDDSTVNTCPNNLVSTITITSTAGGGSGGGSCTASMFMTLTDCTASTTDYVTLTDDGLTVTTVTTGAETVTEPGLVETVTSSSTVTDVSTVTDHEIETTTVTSTATMSLHLTSTVTIGGGGCEVTDPSMPPGGYGSCGDPTVVWLYGLDGRIDYSFTTTNQDDFPFGSSPSIDPVTALTCNRLRSPCNAPDEVVDRCWEAAAIANQFEGQEVADVWNELMT